MRYHSYVPEENETQNNLFDILMSKVDLLPAKKKQKIIDMLSGNTNHMVDIRKLNWLLEDLSAIKDFVSKNTSDGSCVDVDFKKGIIMIDFSYMEFDNSEEFWALFKRTKLVELILIRENIIRISAEYDISIEF